MFKRFLLGSMIFHMILIAGVGIGMRRQPLDLDKISYFQLVTEIQAMDPSTGRNGLKTNGSKGNSVALRLSNNVPDIAVERNPAPVVGKPETEMANEDLKPAGYHGTVQSGANSGTDPAGIQGNNPGTGPGDSSADGSGIPGDGPGVIPPYRIYAPSPEYPAIARRNNWEGLVTLRVLIKTDGTIGEITVFQSSGYEVLDQSALSAVKKWRYQPAYRQGIAVECYRRVPVRFRLGD